MAQQQDIEDRVMKDYERLMDKYHEDGDPVRLRSAVDLLQAVAEMKASRNKRRAPRVKEPEKKEKTVKPSTNPF